MLSRSLKLTDEQKQKVKPIIEDEYKKYQELRTQKNLSPQDRVAKMREIREATNQKLKPIFTEEQWAKFYRPMTNSLQRFQNQRPLLNLFQRQISRTVF
jgi:hypothetical protein